MEMRIGSGQVDPSSKHLSVIILINLISLSAAVVVLPISYNNPASVEVTRVYEWITDLKNRFNLLPILHNTVNFDFQASNCRTDIINRRSRIDSNLILLQLFFEYQ